MIYLDTSALITLISGRPLAHELREFLSARPTAAMGTSTLGFIETVRVLNQIGDYPTLMQDLVREFTEILLSEDVRDAAAMLPRGVRALDAVHVASAQILGGTLELLITYDKRMFDVSRSLGLPTEAPGRA